MAMDGRRLSAYAFKAIRMDVHQLVVFQKRFDLRPDTRKQGVKVIFAKIAKPQMHHPRRRQTRDDPILKVRILAHDDQIMLPGKVPIPRVAWISTHLGERNHRKAWRKPETRGQVFVKEKTLHAAGTTEK